MKATTASALFGSALLAALPADAAPYSPKRDVDTRYPYTGPQVPIGDWVDATVTGNGKGFIRLVEPPAVPSGKKATNSINVISLAYLPDGMTVHFQTPFGLNDAPTVHYGTSEDDLCNTATGYTTSYDRTPPCSIAMTTMCSQYFHNVLIHDLQPGTRYYYSIAASNGTTASHTLSFTTARPSDDTSEFTIAVLNDMGYTNSQGTYKYLNQAVEDGIAFAWHGGDISYADDWYDGILTCEKGEVCYNGSSSSLPNTPPAPFPEDYNTPVPAGELPDQGSPRGGDASPIYETNWDIWQQWMNSIFTKVPYMVSPGNHEAACNEFDGPNNIMTAYLNNNITNGTASKSDLTYYSCPPSQRNFTAFQHRFRMPGNETGGVGNFWYSFDYGNAHFVTLDGETDFAYSPEWPFVRDITGNETLPTKEETFSTDSGPFGYINGSWKDNKSYQQLAWLAEDLASVNRTATPWVFAMTHRPMYSSQVSSYQTNVRNAFEPLLLKYNVDAYFAGHIHWYERIKPMNNLTIVNADIIDKDTYATGTGKSLTTIVNGMAGNIESHSSIAANATLQNYTAVLNQYDFGFSKLTIHNDSVATWQYIKGIDGKAGDTLTMVHSN